MISKLISAFATLLLIGSVSVPSASSTLPPKYGLIDLGVGWANAINGKGQVVGATRVSPTASHATLWDNGTATDLTPSVTSSTATAINSTGQIAGNWVGLDGTSCFVYKNGVASGLPRPYGVSAAQATGISDQGWVVGTWFQSVGPRRFYHGIMWKPNGTGGYTAIDLDPPFIGYEYVHSMANGINKSNTTVGAAHGDYGPELTSWSANAVFKLLGNASSETYGLAINDSGHMCGYYTDWSLDTPFLWKTASTGIVALADLGGGWGRAQAINHWDDVAGFAGNVDNYQCGTLWSKGSVFDLNSLLLAPSDLFIWNATGINDSGSIAGYAAGPDGIDHAVVLVRVPNPTLRVTPSSLFGGAQTSVGTVTIDVPAGPGGYIVTLGTSRPDIAAPTAPNVTIPEGKTTATFTIGTQLVPAATLVTITVTTQGISASVDLTVKALLSGIKLSPTTVVGGTSSTATVTLAALAPAGGVVIALGSTNLAVGAPRVAQVTIPGGAISATFTVDTKAVSAKTTVGITATLAGKVAKVVLTVTR